MGKPHAPQSVKNSEGRGGLSGLASNSCLIASAVPERTPLHPITGTGS